MTMDERDRVPGKVFLPALTFEHYIFHVSRESLLILIFFSNILEMRTLFVALARGKRAIS